MFRVWGPATRDASGFSLGIRRPLGFGFRDVQGLELWVGLGV